MGGVRVRNRVTMTYSYGWAFLEILGSVELAVTGGGIARFRLRFMLGYW